MLWLPSAGRVNVISNIGITGGAVGGTAVPSNATTLLDGAVTELISAANNVQDSWGIVIGVTGTGASATAAEAAMDILIGGATDDVLISALLCGYARPDGNGLYSWFFPLHIPAGVRIAARLASVRISISASVQCTLLGGGVPPFRVGRKVTTYGTQVNNARGQAITPAASGGAATATEITASTAEDHFAVVPGYQPETDTSFSADSFNNIGIGVGAATEQRIGTWLFKKDGGEGHGGPLPIFPAFCPIPAGSRLTMLASGGGANETAQGGLIYAVS